MGYEYPWYSQYSGYGGQQTISSSGLYSNTDAISYCNYWPTAMAREPAFISDNSRAYNTDMSNSAWSRSQWLAQQPGSTSYASDTNFQWYRSPTRADSYQSYMVDGKCYTLPCAYLPQPDDIATAFCHKTVAYPCVKQDNPDIPEVIPRADIFNQFLVSVLGRTPSKPTLPTLVRESRKHADDTTRDRCDEYRAASEKTELSRHSEMMEPISCQTYSMCHDFLLSRGDSWQTDDITTSADSTIGVSHNNINDTGVEDDTLTTIDDIFRGFMSSPSPTDPKPVSRTCKSVDIRREAAISRMQTQPRSGKPEDKRATKTEKDFVCDVCSKVFARRASLRVHTRLHTGVRPYSCADCGRSFSDYSVYVRHRRTHTHERPYACPECGYRFTQSGNLLRHRRNQHGFGST